MSDFIWYYIARLLAMPRISNWLISRAQRTPYSPIVKGGVLYMGRWWLFNPYPDTGASGADKPRWQFPISIRIHHIMQADQDRHLHDHPWNARTVILRGWYEEQRKYRPWVCDEMLGTTHLGIGATATLRYGEFHRITKISPGGVYTMFITGHYRGTWGFDVDGVKVQWRKYLDL